MNVILYHKNCADGFVAMCCARQCIDHSGELVSYIPAQYNEEDKYLPMLYEFIEKHKVERVYVLDFSLLADTITDLVHRGIDLTIIDHHKSAKERMERWFEEPNSNRFTFLFSADNTKSGALLAAEYFQVREELKHVAENISEYDTWQKRLGKDLADIYAEGIYALMAKYGDQAVHCMNKHDILAVGEPRIELRNTRAEALMKLKILCVPHCGPNIVGYAVNASKDMASYVGHKLCELKGTFGIIYFQLDANTVECSIRSNDGKTALEVARAYGGGGHGNAAGFRISAYEFQKWLLVGDM